jgi:chemotaxis response regulator CheB
MSWYSSFFCVRARGVLLNIIIVSQNPLFMEVLAEMLASSRAVVISCIDPETATDFILEKCPEAILVDQAISPDLRSKILDAARSLKKSKVVLLTASENNYILIQTENLTLTRVDDLINALQNGSVNETSITSVMKKT